MHIARGSCEVAIVCLSHANSEYNVESLLLTTDNVISEITIKYIIVVPGNIKGRLAFKNATISGILSLDARRLRPSPV